MFYSEENHVGGTEEDAVRDPNIFRETREKEEVYTVIGTSLLPLGPSAQPPLGFHT